MTKSRKDFTKTKGKNKNSDYSPMSINAKILKYTEQNSIAHSILHHDEVRIIPGMTGDSTLGSLMT